MTRLAPTARSVAATVVVRVLKDRAFAAAVLDAELDRNVQLDARERALATELVYGSLRLHRWLEERLAHHAPRGLSSLDPLVRATLVIAAYQILVLERVPAFAAVNEAVSIARSVSGERVSGFVNAVLRKVAKEPRPSAEELARAALDSADPALAKAIVASIGEVAARGLFATSPPPPLGLRIEDVSARDAWIDRLREARPAASIEAGKVSPHAVLLRGASRVADLPGAGVGAWIAQEEGSQVVGLSLGVREGDVVLDACAGRGNKTGIAARAAGERGAVDAADLHPSKLARLERELARVGLRVRATHAVDWSKGTGDVPGPYDRVLVDAPCSGTGTLRRRPELLLRREAESIAALTELQRAILRNVARLVRPGGRLVYAVCSVLREEAEGVVSIASDVGLVPAPFDAPALASTIGEGVTSFRLLPHEHGTDGYFLASFVRS